MLSITSYRIHSLGLGQPLSSALTAFTEKLEEQTPLKHAGICAKLQFQWQLCTQRTVGPAQVTTLQATCGNTPVL